MIVGAKISELDQLDSIDIAEVSLDAMLADIAPNLDDVFAGPSEAPRRLPASAA